MKKIILTFATIVIAILTTATFSYAKTNTATVLDNIGTINKIEVRGNVEVIIGNGDKNEVIVNKNYYGENALVQNQNGVLRISSYNTEQMIVYVVASDLSSISAYDNAIIKTEKRISTISLDVNLYNNAYAKLTLDNFAANITVNDQAKADLSGSVTEYNLTYTNATNVNRKELAVENAFETKIESTTVTIAKAIAKADNDLVIVE